MLPAGFSGVLRKDASPDTGTKPDRSPPGILAVGAPEPSRYYSY